MRKKLFSDETRQALVISGALLLLPLALLLINLFMPQSDSAPAETKSSEKTVIIQEARQNAPPQPAPSKTAAATVRDAIKQGNFSTAYMEISKAHPNSPEYKELSKQLTEEKQKRKAPGVRKEAGLSASAPIRYFDESTPRDRTADAVYIYFVDISGTMLPRFCIQTVSKRPLKITGFVITADGKNINIAASAVKSSKLEKGVAEWYDIPLDRPSFEAAQAVIKSKKATVAVTGSDGKTARDISEDEKKGLRRILDGYLALGGNLNYLKTDATAEKKKAGK